MTYSSFKHFHVSSLPLSHFSISLVLFFLVLQRSALSSTANVTAFRALGARRDVSRSVLTELVYIFRKKKFGKKVQISLLNIKGNLRWVLRAEADFSQQVVAALKAEAESQRSQKLSTLFAALDDSLPRIAGTEQVRQILTASTTVQPHATGAARAA